MQDDLKAVFALPSNCRVSLDSSPCMGLPYRTMTPLLDIVGEREIAALLGVQPNTVNVWRQRGLLPPPEGMVSGHPCWSWSTIAHWAVETGRLRPASAEPGTAVAARRVDYPDLRQALDAAKGDDPHLAVMRAATEIGWALGFRIGTALQGRGQHSADLSRGRPSEGHGS